MTKSVNTPKEDTKNHTVKDNTLEAYVIPQDELGSKDAPAVLFPLEYDNFDGDIIACTSLLCAPCVDYHGVCDICPLSKKITTREEHIAFLQEQHAKGVVCLNTDVKNVVIFVFDTTIRTLQDCHFHCTLPNCDDCPIYMNTTAITSEEHMKEQLTALGFNVTSIHEHIEDNSSVEGA